MTQVAVANATTNAHVSSSKDSSPAFPLNYCDTESSNMDFSAYDCDIALFEGPERPSGWLSTSFAALSKVVAKAKGAASYPVVAFIKKYLKGTKLVFVIGQAGTGKSTLLNELTGQDLPVGKTHKSGTKAHHVRPAIIEGQQYIFVDTAGFGAADIDDMDNFHDIVACLDALAPFVTIAGVLFVYGGNQARMTISDLATVQWMKCFCGPAFFQSITFVTTKWDSLSDDAFEESWEEGLPALLKEQCIQDLLNPESTGSHRYHGAHVYHHGIRGGKGFKLAADTQRLSRKRMAEERAQTAQSMIRDRYQSPPTVKMQILEENARGIPWDETESAKALQGNPSLLDFHVQDGFARLSGRKAPAISITPEGEPVAGMGGAETQKQDTGHPEANQGGSPSKPPNPSTTGSKHSEKDQFKPQTTWREAVIAWVDVAKDAAFFFFEAKMKKAPPGPTAWSDVWGSLRNWWSDNVPK